LFSLIALIKRNTFRNARLTSSSSRGNGTGDGVGLWTGGVSGCGAKAGVIQGGTAGGGEAGLESSSQVRLSMVEKGFWKWMWSVLCVWSVRYNMLGIALCYIVFSERWEVCSLR
jgi:hypothetical protein